MLSRNGWRMPAPAPCASTYTARAPSGRSSSPDTSPAGSPTVNRSSTDAVMELLERGDQVRLELEHPPQRVVLALLHQCRRVLDRELPDVELRRHVAPRERHGDRCAGQRSCAERRAQEPPMAMLDVVDIH